MRGVRFTAAERTLLDLLLGPTPIALVGYVSTAQQRIATSIRHKLSEAQHSEPLPLFQPLEQALITTSGNKVLALLDGQARTCRQAASLSVSPAQMRIMGAWIANASWIKSKLTIIDVLNKWSQWWPKAWDEFKPTDRPTQLTKESDHGTKSEDTGHDINKASTNIKTGRSTPGFR